MKILVTGAAGFIGYHLVRRLIRDGHNVVGIDNINDYYSTSLKYARLANTGISMDDIHAQNPTRSNIFDNYRFQKIDICDMVALERLCANEQFDTIINLAAQAGVRYSIENPQAYIQSNIVGFLNILECARRWPLQHLIYASSSSVYGGNTKTPFCESDRVDNQVSIYAATKKSNELMANVYSKLYGFPTTGLRFFTVYGPWGRPDMAPMLFSKSIMEGKPIKVFNHGNLSRDFTYIDDIIEGIVKVVEQGPKICKNVSTSPVYNIGCGHPVQLMDFISTLETALGRKAIIDFLPMQPGDVYTTYSDTSRLHSDYGYLPSHSLTEGIEEFARWYRSYYNV